ncbi:sensor histidine kinase [Spongisporangium articulatum]|uniref:histidine kinase n=1 Tax=Spongisporangium articulatum TaxID=3362603 RepID=A0ABW8AJY8_9ACTN
MPSMRDLVARHCDLGSTDLEWLRLLVGDWQMISDLSFADLVLWVPRLDGGWVAVAHCRPSTGATVYYDDLVGTLVDAGRRPQIDRAFAEVRICRARDPEWLDEVPVREETVPVLRAGRPIAVLSRHTNLSAARTPSRLELTYMQCADDLARMISTGGFPMPDAPTGMRRGAPRVGDGLVRLDRDGVVTYASPNAVSALHRLGYVEDVLDHNLSEIVTPLLDRSGQVDETLPLVLLGRAPWFSYIDSRGASLSLRAIPLTIEGERIGALLLLREVSELRRRERELMTKDATIREVHHRVKNNLQTVAALLRLQARRITSEEGRLALVEAMRRVATIALVHETLSEGLGESVDFDDVVGRTLSMAVELAAPQISSQGAGEVAEVLDTGSVPRRPVRIVREGRFGELRAENATPLVLVITELVTNAVEHGLAETGGTITVLARREGNALHVEVRDDGVGVPEGFEPGSSGLGTQIVRALISGEMQGAISWSRRPEGGTVVAVDVTVQPPGSRDTGYDGDLGDGDLGDGDEEFQQNLQDAAARD